MWLPAPNTGTNQVKFHNTSAGKIHSIGKLLKKFMWSPFRFQLLWIQNMYMYMIRNFSVSLFACRNFFPLSRSMLTLDVMYSIFNICMVHFDSLWPSDAIWSHRFKSTLARVMACCLTAPSHYLYQCWLLFSKVQSLQWHLCVGKLTRETSAIIHQN